MMDSCSLQASGPGMKCRQRTARPPIPHLGTPHASARIGDSSQTRGSILLMVMMMIVLGALVGTTLILRAGAEQAAADGSLQRMRLRALVLSGVAGLISEIESQRPRLLDGDDPYLTREWTLWETAGWRGVVRLAPIRGEAPIASSESSKIDINIATPEMLAAVPGMTEESAKAIVGVRASTLIGSPESLADHAVLEAIMIGEDEAHNENPFVHFTSFAFDANCQIGLSDEVRSFAGEPRFQLTVGWSDEVENELRNRVSRPGLEVLKTALMGGTPDNESVLVAALLAAGASAEVCGEVLDAVTTTDDLYPRGRIDINRAPAEVLRCIPGFDSAVADRIISARVGLDARKRRNVAWPLMEGLITPEQFAQAVKWITIRSLVWRVRVEAVIEPTGNESQGRPAGGGLMAWEIVVDASAPVARIAYIRDVTYLPAVAVRVGEQVRARQSEAVGQPSGETADPVAPEVLPSRDAMSGKESFSPSRARSREEVKDTSGGPPPVDNQGKDAPTLRDRRIGRWRGHGT
jgi:DNA uptake protein ComE-like DNA-binding protein